MTGTLTVGVATGSAATDAQAKWALETIFSAFDIQLTFLAPDSADEPEVGYGRTGERLTLVHAPEEWSFTRAEPSQTDVAACAFWWLARVEERIAEQDADPGAFDEHDRFRFAASALAKHWEDNCAYAPVDEIAARIGSQLQLSRRTWAGKPFALALTHDIDIPRRWDAVGIRRGLRDLKRQLGRRDFVSAVTTICSLLAIPFWKLVGSDPYTNAARIGRLERSFGARSTNYLIARHTVPADGNEATYRRGIKSYAPKVLATGGELGLHGSYAALTAEALASELQTATDLAPQLTRHHRFHYLRHKPTTAWTQLKEAGIASDASLGYAERPGFRAGWSRPYQAWDHDTGAPLALTILPLVFMDASLEARYLNLHPGAARELIGTFINHAARHGSCYSVLWHNDKLCTGGAGAFTRLYRYLLRDARANGGATCSVSDALG